MSTHKIRKTHTAKFKVEALRLTDKTEAAAEVARLKRQLAEQTENLAIL